MTGEEAYWAGLGPEELEEDYRRQDELHGPCRSEIARQRVRLEALEKFVRAQPCGCYPATGYMEGDGFLEAEPAYVCERCKTLGEGK